MANKVSIQSWQAFVDRIKGANVVHVCSSEPANYAGLSAVSLGSKNIGSYNLTVPTAGEKKVTIPAVNDVPVTKTGTAQCVIYANTAAQELSVVVDVTPVQMSQGGTANIGATAIGMEVQ